MRTHLGASQALFGRRIQRGRQLSEMVGVPSKPTVHSSHCGLVARLLHHRHRPASRPDPSCTRTRPRTKTRRNNDTASATPDARCAERATKWRPAHGEGFTTLTLSIPHTRPCVVSVNVFDGRNPGYHQTHTPGSPSISSVKQPADAVEHRGAVLVVAEQRRRADPRQVRAARPVTLAQVAAQVGQQQVVERHARARRQRGQLGVRVRVLDLRRRFDRAEQHRRPAAPATRPATTAVPSKTVRMSAAAYAPSARKAASRGPRTTVQRTSPIRCSRTVATM